ncbi:PfkB family carbohydrate kinase [Pseudoruminococcus massiliensis]|uniref:PfkB family carbohydrate kinase n=1 Tax=Pseudoruminococcus massiliensis TaxID=2086583 RepID=UPI003FD7B6D6
MINLVALPCLCVDVFDGTDELRAGGEALNFAVHASKFEEFNVSILGAVGQDSYAKFIMDSVSDKRIDVSHVRVEEDKVTANNRTYLTADGDRYYKDDSWTGDIVDKMILNQDELDFIKKSEVVFIHFWAGCFEQIMICITKISTFLILCDLAVCLATLYVSFSLVFALMRYLQGKVFLIRFYSPTTLSSSRAEFRLPSRLACA